MTESERYRSGDHIAGKYQLVRKLDEGGMGAVWAARNVDLDVHVALKLLRPELGETHAAHRLLAEARMLARLQHPAVVRVHDCGRTEHGDPFVAMELLDGESLADHMVRRGRVAAVEAVSLLLPIVDGLRAAHEAGIVHRDIKPENIFLAKVGGRMQPKLLDFGIALAEAVAARRTTHGAILGSPVYMSPEQARGSEVGPATDLWALSVVLFELVSADLPFSGDNYHAVLRSIIEDECPSLTELGCGDDLLAAIVERGLSKDPARRFATAKDLGTALAEWLIGQGVSEDASHVSLRAGWLGRVSEPPASLAPTVVGSSDRPAARASLPTVTPTRAVVTQSSRHSVSGLSLTASQRGRRGRLIWMASSAGVALLLAGGALWFRSVSGPASVPSAHATESSIPSAAPPPSEKVAHASTNPDAGAPAAVPETAKPRSVPESRPKPQAPSPTKTYRPRGI
ncbi:MAG: protein kinase [Myxococcales bacterium]|nr:protein kinase [Myxococcales bacterium]